jgi:hypothetical protein
VATPGAIRHVALTVLLQALNVALTLEVYDERGASEAVRDASREAARGCSSPSRPRSRSGSRTYGDSLRTSCRRPEKEELRVRL